MDHQSSNSNPNSNSNSNSNSNPNSPNTFQSLPAGSLPDPPRGWTPGPFPHERLDAFRLARQALILGEALARTLPRGYGKLADQLRRALLASYLGVAEAASRSGADRRNRFQCALAEVSEAYAAADAVFLLQLAPSSQVHPLRQLLPRLAAMLTRLAKLPR